jgi:hypothetical protein
VCHRWSGSTPRVAWASSGGVEHDRSRRRRRFLSLPAGARCAGPGGRVSPAAAGALAADGRLQRAARGTSAGCVDRGAVCTDATHRRPHDDADGWSCAVRGRPRRWRGRALCHRRRVVRAGDHGVAHSGAAADRDVPRRWRRTRRRQHLRRHPAAGAATAREITRRLCGVRVLRRDNEPLDAGREHCAALQSLAPCAVARPRSPHSWLRRSLCASRLRVVGHRLRAGHRHSPSDLLQLVDGRRRGEQIRHVVSQ